MNSKPFYIKGVIEGKNSVLFETANGIVLYEKLASSIHSGKKEDLRILQNKVELVKYNPNFESDSLKKQKGEKLEALLLNVTESCNLSCSYCIYSGNYENERIENNTNMSFEAAKKAIDKFIPLSEEHTLISFYGGEPLNNMNLIKKIIDYAKRTYPKKTFVFSMTSNFCDGDKYIKEIIENDIYVNVSLDGPKQIHDKNRRFKNGKPTYDKIIKNLEKFKEIAPEYVRTHFSQNVTCKNSENLPEIIKFFQKNEQFTVSRISNIEPKGLKRRIKKENDNSNSFNFASNYLNSILSEKDPRVLRNLFDQSLREITIRNTEIMPKKLMLNGCCYPSKRKLFVETDGTFYMCEKFGKRVPIGNADEGINQYLIDNTIERFLDIRNNLCTKNCWAQRLCNPCIQSSKDPKGDISKEGLAQICDSNKSQILISLTNYVSLVKENKKLLKDYIDSIQFK